MVVIGAAGAGQWLVRPLICDIVSLGVFQVLAGAAADLGTNTLQEDAFCAAEFAGFCYHVLMPLRWASWCCSSTRRDCMLLLHTRWVSCKHGGMVGRSCGRLLCCSCARASLRNASCKRECLKCHQSANQSSQVHSAAPMPWAVDLQQQLCKLRVHAAGVSLSFACFVLCTTTITGLLPFH